MLMYLFRAICLEQRHPPKIAIGGPHQPGWSPAALAGVRLAFGSLVLLTQRRAILAYIDKYHIMINYYIIIYYNKGLKGCSQCMGTWFDEAREICAPTHMASQTQGRRN